MPSPLISLHLPKSAGTSFLAALQAHFSEHLYRDYGNGVTVDSAHARLRKAWQQALRIDEQGLGHFRCVHGHFVPFKYWLLHSRQPLTFVTWLRDPVERVVSHYHFWMRSYEPGVSGAHHRRVVEENWSLERFCLGDEFRNLYAQYLCGFPLTAFRFVGITEHYAQDLVCFASEILGAPLVAHRENVGQMGGDGRHDLDPTLRAAIAAHHRRDGELYAEALRLRQLRLAGEATRPEGA